MAALCLTVADENECEHKNKREPEKEEKRSGKEGEEDRKRGQGDQ